MKRFLFLLCILSVGLCASAQTPYDAFAPEALVNNNVDSRDVKLYSGEFFCSAAAPVNIQCPGFALKAICGSLNKDLTICAAVIKRESGHSMPPEMENVCKLSDGVRLLPNGVHFSDTAPALLSLAYDPERIPRGYKPSDIYTYYCDTSKNWYRLERVDVDTVNHVITSLTTHFTDFANAIIKVPEMPESKAFVPTEMQDLPDPDPLTGVPMIEAPRVNNMGTAELTYPIVLPPGRHGLQPNLDLHYSSAGGNGLLGVGWSFEQPAVTIDTRWGVPRYDLEFETEAYLVNGEPVLFHDDQDQPIPLPHMSSSFEPRRAQATRFYARDPRNQAKIVRHGQLPDRYWWSVITTDGVMYYYGYNPFTQSIDEQSVIRTAKENIGYWALTYVMDRFGNFMYYANSKSPNNEIHIDTISYTGHTNPDLDPYYKVYFRYSSRPDEQSDARLGVLRKLAHRLCQIHVLTATNKQLLVYRFAYSSGSNSLYKLRLDSIVKIDGDLENHLFECNQPIHQTNVDNYSEEWIHNENQLYAEITQDGERLDIKPASITRFAYADALPAYSLYTESQTLASNLSAFSSSRSEGWNLGGAFTVGAGHNASKTSVSGGANYAYERNKGAVKTMFIDLNGDGLLDHLSVSGHSVIYRKQAANHTLSAPVPISGLSRLSREISSSHTFGAQLDCYANLSYNPSVSSSYTDIYFADINADGLPDLVTPSGIKLNTLLSSGIPSFSDVSDTQTALSMHGNYCDRAIHYGGEVDSNLMCDIHYVLIDSIPLSSVLPAYDGEAGFIEHNMEPDYLDEEHGIMSPQNWHPLPITENGGAKSILDTSSIRSKMQDSFAEDILTEVHNVRSVTAANWRDILHQYYSGDEYIFELGDTVVYVYHKEYDCNRLPDEPNVDIVRVWVSDRSDSIRLNSLFYLLKDTSYERNQARYADGVRLRIQWNKGVHEQNGHLYADTALFLYDGTVGADNYDSLRTSFRIRVQENDVFFFRLSARDDRRFDDAEWVHSVITTTNDTLYNSAHDYLCTGQQNFIAPAAGTALVSVSCTNAGTVPLKVRIMHQNDTILYFTLPASSIKDTAITRAVADTNVIAFYADTLTQEPIWSDVRIMPSVGYWGSLEIDSLGHTLTDTLYYHPDVQIQYSSLYGSSHLCSKLFGPLHKGWGQFAYNNINSDSLIVLSVLQNEEDNVAGYVNNHTSQYEAYYPQIDFNNPAQMADIEANGLNSYLSTIHAYDPLADDKRWIAMHADNPSCTWQAYGNTGSLGQRLHSTSRRLEAVADTAFVTEDIPEYDSPIPAKDGDTQRISTIRKSTRSVQHSLSAGIRIPRIGAGSTNVKTWGTYSVTSDYMDMNGDGFPDFVGKSAVQYTNPWGGIGDLKGILPHAFSSENSSLGKGFSASRPEPEHAPGNGVRDSKMFFGGIGGGISGQIGYDNTNISYIDVNADGLPDMVDATNGRYKYNLGYSFDANWTYLPSLSISSSSHYSMSLNASISGTFEEITKAIQKADGKQEYSICQYSISGGFSASASENKTNTRLLDMNGDGYPDVLTDEGGSVKVRYFNGTSYEPPQTVNLSSLQRSLTANVGANIGVTAGFSLVIFPVKFCFGVHTTPWTVSSTVGNSDFMDMDGDGYVDQVIKDGSNLKIKYNKNGTVPVNLLTSVTNPTGQEIMIDYQLSNPSTNHRTRVWRMVHVSDEIPNAIDSTDFHECKLEYTDAFYDNFERTEYGCENVSIQDQGRKYINEYYENRYYILKGEKKADLLLSPTYAPIIGHRHETDFYDSSDIPSSSICDDINLHVGVEGYYTDYYEGESAPIITTRYNKYYDKRHNLIRYEDYGDIAISSDDWYQTIGYKPYTTYNLRLPSVERVCDGTHHLLRKRRVNYNTYGQAVQIIAEDSLQNSKAIHRLWYDNFNCIDTLRDPQNGNGEWSWRQFEYDDTTHTHITRIRNHFGETRYFKYDLRHGVKNWSMDAAGNVMEWRYDRMGRLIDVVAPNELVNSRPYSVHYIYRLPDHNQTANHLYPYKIPHVTKIAADTAIASIDVTLYDARGQHLQRKSWKFTQGHPEWVTDGLRYNDVWYRPMRTYDPFITDLHIPLWEVDTINYLHYPTAYSYDNLDRNTRMDHPDGTFTSTYYYFEYDISGERRLQTHHFDENGIKTKLLNSPQGWTVQTIAGDGSTTFYQYNPIGELYHVTDADGYHTTYQYDMYGNRIQRTHPDAGQTKWTYAPNGSLIRMQTARLGIISDSISYHYCFDKLMRIVYPNVYNNVYYQYDYAGRIAWYADATGNTRLYYDAMGNVRNTIRRVVMPTEDYVYSFRTETEYDSFGRVKRIVYPDAEQVDYLYYQGGGLRSVWRTQYGYSQQPIVQDMDYDPMGHNIYRRYGNSVVTDYTYEPYRNRLSFLRTNSPGYCTLQDLKYSYDYVGNILQMQQSALNCFGMGGEYDNAYTYDNQYRLRTSGCSTGNFTYDFNVAYSPAGKIGNNTLYNTGGVADANVIYGYDNSDYTHQPRVVFDYFSERNAALFWDANGNLAQVNYCGLYQGRFHDWDEENRLRMVIGNEHAGYYAYDANGERVYKLMGKSSLGYTGEHETQAGVQFDNAVLYPNPYIVITRKGYTKHYYANGERLATVIGGGGFKLMFPGVVSLFHDEHEESLWKFSLQNYENQYPFEYLHETYPVTNPNVDIVNQILPELQYNCGEYHLYNLKLQLERNILLQNIEYNEKVQNPETDIFYIHNNHLGSSSWITRNDGIPVQYMHYLPYGQLLANQTPAGYDERYKFIGKERDFESGYDFFGARFYIPPFLHFASVEPLLDKYMHISPYSYAAWNPIKFIDRDGMDAVLITFPNYRAMYRGYKIPHTGHSGVLLINNKTGLTKYYEYGRYNSELGNARYRSVPNVKIKGGKPTIESLNNVLKTISNLSGNNGDIYGAYIKSDKFDAMKEYAEGVVSESNNPNREPYDIFTNNCATFAEDVITQDKSVDKPTIFIHTPINTVEEYVDNGNARVFYDSNTQKTSWSDEKK